MSQSEPACCLFDDPHALQPAFIIGVTGNADPKGYVPGIISRAAETPEIKAIRQNVHDILDWVRGRMKDGAEIDGRQPEVACRHLWLDPKRRKLVDSRQHPLPPDTHSGYHSRWRTLNLGDTPIVVLSPLAPGIDTLVAESVMEYAAKRQANVTVRAPLPFPLEQYQKSTSFQPGDDQKTAAELQADWDDRKARLTGLISDLEKQPGYQPSRDLFEVALHEDAAGDAAKDLQAVDQTGGRRRYLRYRAAGEYVAAYSDILLAFYDEVHPKALTTDLRNPYVSGSHAIVEVKRRGLTDGLLPIPNTISWADTGPVLHVPVDRGTDGKHVVHSAGSRPFRLLQPLDALQEEIYKDLDEEPQWQETGDRLLRSMADSLRRFHRDLHKLDAKVCEELEEVSANHPNGSLISKLGQPAATIAEGCQTFSFIRFARFRDWVATVSRGLDRDLKKWHVSLFLLGIASLLCLVLSGSDFVNLVTSDSNEGKDRPLWVVCMSTGLFLLGLVLFAVAWWKHYLFCGREAKKFDCDGDNPSWLSLARWRRLFSGRDTETRQFDYRVIAEGLRVQFFWSVSGLFSSVASRYIQRLRGELSWIRYAISSVTFPYRRSCDWFDALDDKEKEAILLGVRDGWVRDQMTFFQRESRRAAVKRDVLRPLGAALSFTGVLLAVYSLFLENLPHLECPPAWRIGLLPLAFFTLVMCALMGALRGWLWNESQGLRGLSRAGEKAPWWTIWLDFIPQELLERWLPTQASVQKASPILRRVFTGLLCVSLTLCLILVMNPGDDLNPWIKLAKVIVFSGSGFILLWIERNFFEEHHRRYSAMHGLFHGADQRLTAKLEALHLAIHHPGTIVTLVPVLRCTPQTLPPPPPLTPVQCIIRDIQEVLLSLGQEALAENAEWIVMRRSRRIEPHRPAL